MSEKAAVCVTGGSGFIGSWVVKFLLDRGYTVHATVQNINDPAETKHLEELASAAGATDRLRLFQIDLVDYASILPAVTGTSGVIHLASPCAVEAVADLQTELFGPNVKGTLNVLGCSKQCGVKKVVMVSSMSAMVPSPNWPSDVVKDETCWTDEDFCKKNEIWYSLYKTLAEKAAWEYSKENGIDLVTVLPGTVMGPNIPPRISSSMGMLLYLLQGGTEPYENFYAGSVHVKDVAQALILLYENPLATGRHICTESICHFSDFASKVAELYPEYKTPSFPKDTQPGLLRSKNASKKLIEMGMSFTSMEDIIKDSVECLKSKGVL